MLVLPGREKNQKQGQNLFLQESYALSNELYLEEDG
jgi:hypothetical protein